MNLHLAVGGEVDVASSEDLTNAVKDIKTEIALCQPPADPKPIRRKYILSKQFAGPADYDNTATPQILTTDGSPCMPSVGRVWDVRSIVFFIPVSPSTTPGTSFPTINGGNPNVPASIDIRQSLQAAPMGTTFTKGSVLINPNEEMYVVVNAPTAQKTYVAVIEIDDYAQCEYEAQHI